MATEKAYSREENLVVRMGTRREVNLAVKKALHSKMVLLIRIMDGDDE